MAGYEYGASRHGHTTNLDTIPAMQHRIRHLEQLLRMAKARDTMLQNRITKLREERDNAEQRAIRYRNHQHATPTVIRPTRFGGPEGLRAAAAEAATWRKPRAA